MALDYSYYTDTFLGDIIPSSSSFSKYVKRATVFLESRLAMGVVVDETMFDCLCELAEYEYIDENINDLSSEKVGDWSRTYDRQGKRKKTRDGIITMYLGKTGLIFRGI